uniref:Uncharacterized protein n=1 Tax=Laticauda laticaudata TaxID=8630 RepID=A0A8C5SB08_LATLA
FHYLTYCTWDGPILFGEDLYVMPEFRGSGGIRGYPHKVGSLDEKGEPQDIPFQRCSQFRFISAESPQATIDFFHKRGAIDVTIRNNWHVFRIDRDPLVKLVEGVAAKLNPVSSQL